MTKHVSFLLHFLPLLFRRSLYRASGGDSTDILVAHDRREHISFASTEREQPESEKAIVPFDAVVPVLFCVDEVNYDDPHQKQVSRSRTKSKSFSASIQQPGQIWPPHKKRVHFDTPTITKSVSITHTKIKFVSTHN